MATAMALVITMVVYGDVDGHRYVYGYAMAMSYDGYGDGFGDNNVSGYVYGYDQRKQTMDYSPYAKRASSIDNNGLVMLSFDFCF